MAASLSKTKPRKEPRPIRLHLALSGSSFDEKMLGRPARFWRFLPELLENR